MSYTDMCVLSVLSLRKTNHNKIGQQGCFTFELSPGGAPMGPHLPRPQGHTVQAKGGLCEGVDAPNEQRVWSLALHTVLR